jgi:hypothetical protein
MENHYHLILENSSGRMSDFFRSLNGEKRDFGKEMKRTSDRYFEPVGKVILEFEKKVGQSIEDLEVSTLQGKRLRGNLLVKLKDLGGLKYVVERSKNNVVKIRNSNFENRNKFK